MQEVHATEQPLRIAAVASIPIEAFETEPAENAVAVASSDTVEVGECAEANGQLDGAHDAVASSSAAQVPRHSSDVVPPKKRQPVADSSDDENNTVPHSAPPAKLAKRRHTMFLPSLQPDNPPRKLPNNDPMVHAMNTLYNKLCLLCGVHSRSLVYHYAEHHHEVYVSRPSPELGARLRQGDIQFTRANSKITGICCFCETEKSFDRPGWQRHMLTHTGELPYHCQSCNVSVTLKREHTNCDPVNVRHVFAMVPDNATHVLIGFMCSICNYLRVKRSDIVNHLMTQHSGANPDDCCDKIILVDTSVNDVNGRRRSGRTLTQGKHLCIV